MGTKKANKPAAEWAKKTSDRSRLNWGKLGLNNEQIKFALVLRETSDEVEAYRRSAKGRDGLGYGEGHAGRPPGPEHERDLGDE